MKNGKILIIAAVAIGLIILSAALYFTTCKATCDTVKSRCRPSIGCLLCPIGPVQVMCPFLPCDLDFDFDCGDADLAIFDRFMGGCENGDNYNEPADADHDGCITEKDRQELFPEGREWRTQ
ncbi:MAG: hypothetical protein V1676_00435 [Candidatus Diapherotrites archaeon]